MNGKCSVGSHKRPSSDIESRINAAIAERLDFGGGSVACESDKEEEDRLETSKQQVGFESLDHTADVQLHSWAPNFYGALEQLALCMFGTMTNLAIIEIDQHASESARIEALGHDRQSLVFSFLNEWLFHFHDTGFVPKQVAVEWDGNCSNASNSGDVEAQEQAGGYTVRSTGSGECLDLRRHEQLAEIKAITYSNMQILEANERCDIWVIVDI